jgi:NCAIR mutase (PurE)-related protein
MVENEIKFDFARPARIGLSEAVLCDGKSKEQIEHIIALARDRGEPLLLTRLGVETFRALDESSRHSLDFDPVSRTGILGKPRQRGPAAAAVAIVSAGSSDAMVVREAARTLEFHGERADIVMDVGVAGLWRLLERKAQLEAYRVLIVVAGMDGALFSVAGGLFGGVVIAIPTATGYGVANGGTTALHAALVSCAPGVVAVNVGNGYGGACAALRVLRPNIRESREPEPR